MAAAFGPPSSALPTSKPAMAPMFASASAAAPAAPPPTEPNLRREELLISWEDVYIALSDSNTSKYKAIRPFLADVTNQTLLKRPLEPFQASSTATKSQFETRTAAINITPAEDAAYNIKDIKDDALWLTAEAKIDEISALRIVDLEWQKRPINRLLSTDPESEQASNSNNWTSFGASIFAPKPEDTPGDNPGSFESSPRRRSRLLRLYLSERLHILKVSELLFRRYACTAEPGEEYETVSEAICEALCPENDGSAFLTQCAASLTMRVERLSTGPPWSPFEKDGERPEQDCWAETQLLEIIAIFQYVFDVSDADTEIPSADAVTALFKFLGHMNFFANLPESPTPSLPYAGVALKSAVQLASLALLKLDKVEPALNLIIFSDESSQSSDAKTGYLSDLPCIITLHKILIAMAEKPCTPAASAIFAWSTIISGIRDLSGPSRRGSEDMSDLVSYPALPQQARQGTRRDDFASALNEIQALSPADTDMVTYMASCALDHLKLLEQIVDVVSCLNTAFSEPANQSYESLARRLLSRLIVSTSGVVQYGPEILRALLAVLGAEKSYWNFVDRRPHYLDAVAQYFSSGYPAELVANYLEETVTRYPLEATPYHQLLNTLLSLGELDEETISTRLLQVQTAHRFTQRLPKDFRGYDEAVNVGRGGDSDDEFEGTLLQELLIDLPVFVSARQGPRLLLESSSNRELATGRENRSTSSAVVPAGAIGIVADEDSRPIIVSWVHEHSPLRYMVGCLYTNLAGNDHVDASTMDEIPLDQACDIINLITTMVTAIKKLQQTTSDRPLEDDVIHILEGTFVDADPKKDLINIIAELFETHIQRQQELPGDQESLDVLVSCVKFFHAVALFLPTRIWPVLSRSKLLDLDGNGGALVSIVTAVEMITGRYELLISCIRLFEILVEIGLKPGSQRPTKPSRAVSRFNSNNSLNAIGESLPQRVASAIMTSFSRILISVFGNSRGWRYESYLEQAEISTRLAMVFDKILHYTYGFDDEAELQKKVVVSVLADSAACLSEVLLSNSPTHQVSGSLLDMLNSGLASIVAMPSPNIRSWQSLQIQSSLSLYETIIRISVFCQAPISFLEQQLFKAAPTLARLFAAQESFKTPVSRVLGALISSAARSQSEPPSLLGHMGAVTARGFLEVLIRLSRPLEDAEVELSIWKMLSAVVQSRQQWFTISLLTGSTPRDRSRKGKDKAPSQTHGRPILEDALSQLTDISKLDPQHALAMLGFLSLCQDHWSWALGELRRDQKVINSFTGYIRSLKREPGDEPLTMCNEAAIAASIAKVLAMYLHSCFQVGDFSAAKSIVPHLQYFRKYGVAAPRYNSSLHVNLKAHTEKDYNLSPSNFKHTTAFPTEFGNNYFYDVPFASKVLNLRRSNKGKTLQGTEKDLQRANTDLSLVEAQVDLLTQWKVLVIELSKAIKQESSIPSLLTETVKKCLEENAGSTVPEAIFDRLRHARLDLALVLLQKLVAADIQDNQQEQDLRSLFSVAWDTVVKSQSDFEASFQGDDVPYYRTLLQILFVTLRALTKAPPHRATPQSRSGAQRAETSMQAPKESRQILEVLLHVVIKGFRSLASILHESPTACEPNDFVLLTAILQTILRIPGIELLYSQIALQFANNNVSGYATSLFSWADQLLINGDPIYGEFAILFLLEMSSIPLVAEAMAVDGVLSQITSADLMQIYSRPKGMGPFDEPNRLHSIWTRGLLPLCLNLLDAVGAPIAAEIVSFLNHFPNQLKRLGTELSNRNGTIGTRPSDAHITLGMASEVHSLSLIWLILERYRLTGAGTGTLMQDIPQLAWDKAVVKEDVDDWVEERRKLGSLIFPANEREAELSRVKPQVSGHGESRLEERIYLELGDALDCLKADGAS